MNSVTQKECEVQNMVLAKIAMVNCLYVKLSLSNFSASILYETFVCLQK